MSDTSTGLVGRRIAAWRKERGISGQKLADAVGISRSYLGDIEAGRTDGSVRVLKSVTAYLGKTLDEVISGEDIAGEDSAMVDLGRGVKVPMWVAERIEVGSRDREWWVTILGLIDRYVSGPPEYRNDLRALLDAIDKLGAERGDKED